MIILKIKIFQSRSNGSSFEDNLGSFSGSRSAKISAQFDELVDFCKDKV